MIGPTTVPVKAKIIQDRMRKSLNFLNGDIDIAIKNLLDLKKDLQKKYNRVESIDIDIDIDDNRDDGEEEDSVLFTIKRAETQDEIDKRLTEEAKTAEAKKKLNDDLQQIAKKCKERIKEKEIETFHRLKAKYPMEMGKESDND